MYARSGTQVYTLVTLMNTGPQFDTKDAVVLTGSDLKVTMIYLVNPLQLY